MAVVVGWRDNSLNETKYRIDRKQGKCTSTEPWSAIWHSGPDVTLFRNYGLLPDTDYCYRAKVINADGTSAFSNCSQAKTSGVGTPVAPLRLKAMSVSSSGIKLTWKSKSSDESGFGVYRMTGIGKCGLLTTTAAGVTTFTDLSATGNMSANAYSYYVTAYNASGNSPGRAVTAVPYSPKNLNAAPSPGAVTLSWTVKATKNTGFEIHRKEGTCSSTGATFDLLTTTAPDMLSYDDTGVTSGKTYAYKIRTVYESTVAPVAIGLSGSTSCVEVVAQ